MQSTDNNFSSEILILMTGITGAVLFEYTSKMFSKIQGQDKEINILEAILGGFIGSWTYIKYLR